MGNYAIIKNGNKPLGIYTRKDVHDILLREKKQATKQDSYYDAVYVYMCTCSSAETDVKETVQRQDTLFKHELEYSAGQGLRFCSAT